MNLLFCLNGFTITSWFVTQKKSSFMLLGVDDTLQTNLVCGDQILEKTMQEKVLGVTLDNKLNFATHLLNITKSKFNTLT